MSVTDVRSVWPAYCTGCGCGFFSMRKMKNAPPTRARIIRMLPMPPARPPMPPPMNMEASRPPAAKPASGPSHLLPLAGAAAGACAGFAGAAVCWDVVERCLPMLLPPPMRLASASCAVRPKLISATKNRVKILLMETSLIIQLFRLQVGLKADLPISFKTCSLCAGRQRPRSG